MAKLGKSVRNTEADCRVCKTRIYGTTQQKSSRTQRTWSVTLAISGESQTLPTWFGPPASSKSLTSTQDPALIVTRTNDYLIGGSPPKIDDLRMKVAQYQPKSGRTVVQHSWLYNAGWYHVKPEIAAWTIYSSRVSRRRDGKFKKVEKASGSLHIRPLKVWVCGLWSMCQLSHPFVLFCDAPAESCRAFGDSTAARLRPGACSSRSSQQRQHSNSPWCRAHSLPLALEIAEKDWTNSVFCAFAKAPIAFGYAGAGLPPVPLLGGMAAMLVEMWPTWWWEDLENHLENIGKCGQ